MRFGRTNGAEEKGIGSAKDGNFTRMPVTDNSMLHSTNPGPDAIVGTGEGKAPRLEAPLDCSDASGKRVEVR